MLSDSTIKQIDDLLMIIVVQDYLIDYANTVNPRGKRNRANWVDVVVKTSKRKNAKVSVVITYDLYKELLLARTYKKTCDLYTKNIDAYNKHLAIQDRRLKLERLGVL